MAYQCSPLRRVLRQQSDRLSCLSSYPREPTEQELGTYRTTPTAPMTLFALDAESGKELWSSRNAMAGNTTHFSEPVVAAGKVFVVDHKAHIFAFGLR